jgi:iron complex transport system substrate-binding protein
MRISNKRNILYFSAIVSLILSACAQNHEQVTPESENVATEQSSSESNQTSTELEVTDDLGNELVFTSTPERIVANSTDMVNLIYDIGGQAVGVVSPSSGELPSGAEEAENLGTASNVSIEAIIALEPDLVISSPRFGAEKVDILSQADVPIAIFDINNLEDLEQKAVTIGQLIGKEAEAQNKVNETLEAINQTVDQLPEDESDQSYIVLNVTPSSISMQSAETVAVELANLAGGHNVGEHVELTEENQTSAPLNIEFLLQEDPDLIFFVFHGSPQQGQAIVEQELESSPVWGELTAVQENRLYTLDSTRFLSNPVFEYDEAFDEMVNYFYTIEDESPNE